MEELEMISIITPCYNGEAYLDKYFQGILSQQHRNIELIFVNDGSSDKTEEIAQRYGKELEKNGMRFVYIYQENAGQAAAMNKGLACFQGDYLTWLDSDDILLPDNLSKKLSFLKNNKEYNMVLNEAQIVDARNIDKRIGGIKRTRPEGDDHFFEDLLYERNVVYVPGTTLVRRESVLKAIPSLHIYESREGQNFQMLLPLAYTGKCGYLEEELLKCVAHGDSHSRQKRTLDEQFDRRNNFIEICCETLKNIPGISEQEQEEWYRKIRIHQNLSKIDIAVAYLNYGYYKMAREELKMDHYSLKHNEKFFCLFFKKAIRKIKRLILG